MILTDKNPKSPSRWPKCLTSFQLRRLVIKRTDGPLCSNFTLLNELQRLSHGLEVLKIDAIGASDAIFPSMGPNDQSSSKRSNAHQSTQSTLSSPQPWDLGVSFPHLEKLVVKSPSHPNYLDDRLFALLPRSLLHFELSGYLDEADLRNFRALPPSLQTLKVQPITQANIRSLPPTLTNVGDYLPDCALWLLASDERILPNLEFYPWTAEEGVYDALIQWFLEGKSWPDKTRRILISQESEFAAFQNLPRDLVFLSVGSSNGCDFSAESMDELPSKLTTLHLGRVEWSDIMSNTWPSSLTEFELGFDARFSVYDFIRLPRTLKKLSINKFCTKYFFDMYKEENDGSCDGDRCRELGLQALREPYDAALWRELKPTLSAEYVQAVEIDGALLGLPLGLTDFLIEAAHRLDAVEPLLPPLVRTFATDISTGIGSQRFFSRLSPSLASLTFSHRRDNEEISSYTDLEAFKVDHKVSTFPKLTVTSLTLEGDFPPQLALYFPPTLRHLNLQSSRFTWETPYIQALPRQLETLKLACDDCFPEGFWCAHLPASLKVLDLDGLALGGSQLELLPPHLTEISAPFYHVSLREVLKRMPRQLRRLRVLPMFEGKKLKATRKKILDSAAWTYLCESYIPFRRLYDFTEAFIKYDLQIGRHPEKADLEDETNLDDDESSEDGSNGGSGDRYDGQDGENDGSEIELPDDDDGGDSDAGNGSEAESGDDNGSGDEDDGKDYVEEYDGVKDAHKHPVKVEDIDQRIVRRFAR